MTFEVVTRGLQAEPLNAALTEVLIKAHADSGAVEVALRVYQVHDRALADSGFGGAPDETPAVIDSIYVRRSNASAAM